MKDTIICDIDGTIADLTHRLHHIKLAPGSRVKFGEHAGTYRGVVPYTEDNGHQWGHDLAAKVDFDGIERQCFKVVLTVKKDWNAFHASVGEDAFHHDMRTLLWMLYDGLSDDAMLAYVSGRMDSCRMETLAWLKKHNFPEGRLYMRAEGDYRPDFEVKEEILDRDLKLTPDDVLCVLDDRDQVVRMWRRRGVRVLQGANGDF